MNHILVVYGTREGQTKKIAEFIEQELKGWGHKVTLLSARQIPKDFRMTDYDGIVAGGPLHMTKYPKELVRFIKRNSDFLYSIPTAFFTVCLGVMEKSEDTKLHLRTIEQKFFVDSKWYPTIHTTFAGALIYSKYNWLVRFFIKRIAAKGGGSTDVTKDTEYTNWSDVRNFVKDFSRRLRHTDQAHAALSH
jgi:menaquinone-dependent protoporphyrinogen oxidase